MSNSGVLASIQEYVKRLQRREEGYTEEGLRGFNWHKAELAGCDLSGLNLREFDVRGADLSEAKLSRAKLRGANLSGANLSEAYLSEAYLSEADLTGAYLSEANLSGANLWGADLSNADLSRAYLCDTNLIGANLCEADLSGADMNWANLRGANLSKANLSKTYLREADLSDADLTGANLSKADLSGANLRGAVFNWDQIPLVVNIDATILSAIEGDRTLDMAEWHICETTHCRAGWAVVLAGEEGRKLEEQFGTNAAAALIYTKSDSHPVPNWYVDNETALEDIKHRAEQQLAASQLISLEEKGIEIG